MAPPATPADRHEPLPGLLGLPAHFLRQLSRRGRRAVAAAGLVLLCAAVVGAIVLTPRITESKREHAAAEQRAHARAAAEERARLVAEQRPRLGVVAVDRATGSGALIAGVEHAITRDARRRATTGELRTRVRRTDCRVLGRELGRLLLDCTAVTGDVAASPVSGAVVVGYPYGAAVSPTSGRYAICKTSGHPGEGSFTHQAPVELPRACGG